MIELTGLWKHGKNGRVCYSGKLGGMRVLVFANRHKRNHNFHTIALPASKPPIAVS